MDSTKLCSCKPGKVCAYCEPFECSPDEHYCKVWKDVDPVCQCGLTLTNYEAQHYDCDDNEWHYLVWAASQDDVTAFMLDNPAFPKHDVWCDAPELWSQTFGHEVQGYDLLKPGQVAQALNDAHRINERYD